MKAIIDCNSFYCSCERLFRPELDTKPVVVLSNNDGCIISRSDEAKQIGVGMAGPYFLAKPLIEKHNVATFSSNYNLYGDMSKRVMDTLRALLGDDNVEVYSVDEAFLDLREFNKQDFYKVGLYIRETVEQWTGIKVSIGLAPTKVLCKVANHLAKKYKEKTQCVVVLDTNPTWAVRVRRASEFVEPQESAWLPLPARVRRAMGPLSNRVILSHGVPWFELEVDCLDAQARPWMSGSSLLVPAGPPMRCPCPTFIKWLLRRTL